MRITQDEYVNSLGMRFKRINAGEFIMGADKTPLPLKYMFSKTFKKDFVKHYRNGNFDEYPRHKVVISKPFYIGVFEVTNAQYEQFDSEHCKLRGKLGFSKNNDEAAVFVSWYDAAAFCKRLSQKEGLPYRLPTEAEWEHACRAGAVTHYNTGKTLPASQCKNQKTSWYPAPERSQPDDIVSLKIGESAPNPWGLFDMHGNVEEWCYDWYEYYKPDEQKDPVAQDNGEFKVTRGGSHSTELYYLRSASRAATLPEEKSWIIGFRVVIGEIPKHPNSPHKNILDKKPKYAVSETGSSISTKIQHKKEAFFIEPRIYTKIPPDSNGPMYLRHNHCPAITECPNGDLLVIWYSCITEWGRELAILSSRLRCDRKDWEPASLFWHVPARNNHASALWTDTKNSVIYHFNGMSAAATWGNLATIMRTSEDNGITWSRAKLIIHEHGIRHMPIPSVFRTSWGDILLPCDGTTLGNGGTAVHLSNDHEKKWIDTKGTIAGIHASVIELKDGRLMALGRGDNIDGRMPKSVSSDHGKTWTYTASPFKPIEGGQRSTMIRLKEGSIFFASFDNELEIKDSVEKKRKASGLFGALSYDEGETWCVRRLITDGKRRKLWGGGWTHEFKTSSLKAEPMGYLNSVQASDGTIHLISSAQHYAFNQAWLEENLKIPWNKK
ncbi:MAG: SUMF1/EgtB/PvdO family nonheme iron enzyme [Planctomycetota bacterium]